MKSYSILFLLPLAWVGYACSNSEGKNETMKKNSGLHPVRVVRIEKQDVKPVIHTSGLFTTDDETMLAFKTGGVVQRIFVKEGDAIRKGQLLATLDLTEIEAQVAQAKLAFDKSSRDFERVSNLYRDSVATLEQFQNARTGMEVAQRQLDAANFNRLHSEIHALSNGFVLRKMVSEGQVIAPGVVVFQTNGASQSSWKLRVGVSDREWALVSVGDKAAVTTDALPGVSLSAFVSRKSEGVDGMSGTFTLELTVEKTKQTLASGLFGKASIQTSHSQPLWSIPYEALLDGNAQSGYVFTTHDSRTVQKTTVVVSSIERDRILVSAGLDSVQFLVVAGSAYLRDGSSIQVIP